MKIIDLTHTFIEIMPVFPGDDLPRLNKNIDSENGIVHFDIKTGMHVGTHMDGPLHMLSNGRKLSEMSVEKFVANGHIIDARGREEVGVDLLENKEINEGD
jgi:kynurenine formamidase